MYQILEPEARDVFKIDSSMGTISLISPVDFEAKAEYHFTVQVKDSGEPSLYATEPAKVTVRILDLNDCPPQFTTPEYAASIIFPAVRDTEVVRITAHDADSAVAYSIAEGNLHNAFSIHPNTGVITVSNVSEFRHFYQLVVKVSDGLYKASATVKVNVTNLTASDLGFEQKVYSASISENLKTVKTLAALKAGGCFLNEPLLYSIVNPENTPKRVRLWLPQSQSTEYYMPAFTPFKHMYAPMEGAAIQVATCSSRSIIMLISNTPTAQPLGAIWAPVSCPRTLPTC